MHVLKIQQKKLKGYAKNIQLVWKNVGKGEKELG